MIEQKGKGYEEEDEDRIRRKNVFPQSPYSQTYCIWCTKIKIKQNTIKMMFEQEIKLLNFCTTKSRIVVENKKNRYHVNI